MSRLAVRHINKQEEQRYTLGVVYEPNVVDSQGDFSDASEIEKACHKFMQRLQDRSDMAQAAVALMRGIFEAIQIGETARIDITEAWEEVVQGANPLNDMHEVPFVGERPRIVECYLAPVDFSLGAEQIQKGTWLMGIIWPAEYWAKIKTGERTGLSMEGTGRGIEMNAS